MTFGSVRRATEVDAPELLRLRIFMFEAMGVDPGPEDAPWRNHAIAVFEARLVDRENFAGFVVDAPGEQLAAGAIAWVGEDLPRPGSPDGSRGHLANVCVDPRYRGQGLGRAVATAADAWLAATGVGTAELAATEGGEGIYRSLGWTDPSFPTLIRRY